MSNFLEGMGITFLVLVAVAVLLCLFFLWVAIDDLKAQNRDLKERVISFDLSHHRIHYRTREQIKDVETGLKAKVGRRDAVMRVLAKRSQLHDRQIECLKKGKANKVTPKPKRAAK